MMKGLAFRSRLPILAGALLLLMAPAAIAQTSDEGEVNEPPTAVRLLTRYPSVAVEPGDTVSLDLQIEAPNREVVDLEIVDLPDDWSARIRGGGFVIDRVMVDDGLIHDLDLEVDIPITTPEGTYPVSILATGEDSTDRLDLDLTVAAAVGGGVSLAAEFPALRGPSDVEFTFTLELANETGEELEFGLQAQGPAGWQIDARPAGQSRASSVTVSAGGSERITVEVDPPDFTTAGTYPVTVQAAGGGDVAATDLAVEITGNFEMLLTTADERLSVDVEAGSATDVALLVVNQGTAPLFDVSLSATPPQGWEVEFSPDSIDRIEAGGSADVTATITPARDAIAGDYRVTLRSRSAEVSDSVEMRTTVKTSALWGFVGVAVIVIALAALGLVFRRFGRR